MRAIFFAMYCVCIFFIKKINTHCLRDSQSGQLFETDEDFNIFFWCMNVSVVVFSGIISVKQY